MSTGQDYTEAATQSIAYGNDFKPVDDSSKREQLLGLAFDLILKEKYCHAIEIARGLADNPSRYENEAMQGFYESGLMNALEE